MARTKRSLDERIRELEHELVELEEQYKTQLYFETMPEYDPMYKYCYSTSNMKISNVHHHVDHWLRAVIKHMATRRTGHGGASTSAVLVSVPVGFSDQGIENWLSYVTEQLRKQAKKHGKRKIS
jgi:hypothetical protein